MKFSNEPTGLSTFDASLNAIVSLLKEGKRFLFVSHQDPDADGIGSMLALGRAMSIAGKEIVCLVEEPLLPPLTLLTGSDNIVHTIDADQEFSAVLALDCSDVDRISGPALHIDKIVRDVPLINIDHHITNSLFGDMNLVDPSSSSTGEIVFKLIDAAGFSVDREIAENVFAAIQTDTGSFAYDNTSISTFNTAARLMGYGVNPWKIYRNLMIGYTVAGLKLLRLALGTLDFFCDGKIGILYVSSDMIRETGALPSDTQRFVDYPRFVEGVEIAAFIRQTDERAYKFSLRSNGNVDVAKIASLFGGGGHHKAAGFACEGDIDSIKMRFINESARIFNETAD